MCKSCSKGDFEGEDQEKNRHESLDSARFDLPSLKIWDGTRGASSPWGADVGWQGFKRLDFIALSLPVPSASTIPFCVGDIFLLDFWLRSWARWSCLHMCFHLTFHKKTNQLCLNYSEITCVPKGLQVWSGSWREENDQFNLVAEPGKVFP